MKRKTWKKIFAAFLAAICLPVSSLSIPTEAQAADAADAVIVDTDGHKVVIGNDYISREFSTEDNHLSTVNITNMRTDNGDTVFTPASGSEEFKIRVTKESSSDTSNREFTSSQLTLNGAPVVENTEATINDIAKSGKKVTFHFEPYEFKGVTYTISEVIVMYDGDHFMRKYMEISVPEDQKDAAVLDYIDLESLVTNEDDVTWTIPRGKGGIVQMEEFRANLGQPIYIQGMFFGCEFPETDTEIVDHTGYMRYYTGKSFSRLEADNQLTEDGKYVTWQTVAGAARSTDQLVVQADFFDYIKTIATPSEFRIQYNSWFDYMKNISDENIRASFIEMDRELNKAGVRPLDSYVVDDGWVNYNKTEATPGTTTANECGITANESGFWEFNDKFPGGLAAASELVHKFGSNFGVWVGPRGGYGYHTDMANMMTEKGKGSKAGSRSDGSEGSIDVADRTYVKNFTEMTTQWMKDYGVNYWKWDGFADNAQYNTFAEADGVPGYSESNRHMTGGYKRMYHVTDLWEAWIDLFEAVRQCEKENDNVKNLWISITCYVNPSPWFLQWVNSVWLQCFNDQNDAGSSTSKMDRQLTYRDASYYVFLKENKFQFPLANIYNHDPIYGVEGTGMKIDTATDEQFKNYLYMLAMRGTAFWELYFSDSIMTEGKYEVTGEFLKWAEENYHILKNAKMFGDVPSTGISLTANPVRPGVQNAYGYSCFDGTEGIISFRNAATTEKTITVKFDRVIGVPEDAGKLEYYMEHSHNLSEDAPTTGTWEYGQDITYTLKPDEVRILRVSKKKETEKPEFATVYSDGANLITVKFSEKVKAKTFKVNGTAVEPEHVEASADACTFRLTVSEDALQDKSTVTVTAEGVQDMAGNALKENTVSFRYHKNNTTLSKAGLFPDVSKIADAEDSLTGNNGFSISAEVYTKSTGEVMSQGNEYAIGINEDGTAYFTLNGATAVSGVTVNDGEKHVITGVKENNGILKIYIDGQLEGSAYRKENQYYEVKAADIVVGNEDFYGVINVKAADAVMGYDAVADEFGDDPETPAGKQNWASGKTVVAKWAAGGADAAGNPKDRPMSQAVDGTKTLSNFGEFGADSRNESSYLEVDLGDIRNVSKINLYRYWGDKSKNEQRTYRGTVIVLSDTSDFTGSNVTTVYNSDKENFHKLGAGTDETYVESEDGKTITFNSVSARYVRVYMHGSDTVGDTNNSGNTNHVVELEVLGTESGSKADYTVVNAALDAAGSLTKTDYEDFSAVDTAVNAVETGKDASEQAAVNAMAANIFKAIADLERTAAKELGDELQKAESRDREVYTEVSVAEYNKILADAKAVLDNPASTKDALKAALTQVKAAKNVLAEKTDKDYEAEAAKKALGDVIRRAEAYKDSSKYTKASWDALQTALAEAKRVWGTLGSMKSELDPVRKALETAISGLKAESSQQISEGGNYTVGDYNYKVTSLSKQTVEVTGLANQNLTKVNIKETVSLGGKTYTITSIGKTAFKKNQKITTVVLGKNIEKVDNSAFEGCKKLKKVTIKSRNLTQIGKKAFMNCKNLRKVTIKSKKLKKLAKNAFKGIHKKAVIKNASKKK